MFLSCKIQSIAVHQAYPRLLILDYNFFTYYSCWNFHVREIGSETRWMLTKHENQGVRVLENSEEVYRLPVGQGMFCICAKFKFKLKLIGKRWKLSTFFFTHRLSTFSQFSLDLLPFLYYDTKITSFNYFYLIEKSIVLYCLLVIKLVRWRMLLF